MSPQAVIAQCLAAGVEVRLDGTLLRARGAPAAVKDVSDVLRRHKAAVVEHLAAACAIDDLVQEFMEVDGLSLEEAQALAAVSIMPRPPAEWLAMIAELDSLIDRYCALTNAPQASRYAITQARRNQALVNIPATLAWFRCEVANLDRQET